MVHIHAYNYVICDFIIQIQFLFAIPEISVYEVNKGENVQNRGTKCNMFRHFKTINIRKGIIKRETVQYI